jgi:hypothetical protein
MISSCHVSIEKPKALALVLHCADISHPGKPWSIHHSWTQSLMEEFFTQGEKEKELGLPCSPLCDRENTLVAESQIGITHNNVNWNNSDHAIDCLGFIQYIVEPSFIVMGDMLDKVLKSHAVVESETPSTLIAAKNMETSLSPSPSVGSSNESNPLHDEHNR